MYTDGVTEAMNEHEEQFTGGRLEKELIGFSGRSVQEIIAGIMEKVISFAHDRPQSDDITIMVIEFKGSNVSSEN
jgi:sigma-B regulation protein RsbU (phosphoserine phosphatase)